MGLVSTGRGGMGNLRTETPMDEDQGGGKELPHIKQKRFTTGRGGMGNMMDNIDADSTRASQGEGIETQPAELRPTSSKVGRGGYGNVKAAQKEEKSLMDKAKSFFKLGS